MLQGKDRAPLYEALVAHDQLRAHAFHVPGHKQRAEWGDTLSASYYSALLALDVTELSDTDDLHHPEGPIVEAQKLAAECYGAEETRFLVGGSTAGNLAMIIGVCHPGDLVLVQRNVHKSIIHGLMLAGAKALLLPPDIDETSGLATVPGKRLLQAALEQHRDAKAVILSAPNYYGMSPDLKPLVDVVHQYGVPVLIDEAHGAHFGFHPSFPDSALRAGADLVVQSTHKMLSSMTMGAMLHMQGERIQRAAIRHTLTMVQSSSPSFPIMASLDLARRQLQMQGEQAFLAAMEAVSLAVDGIETTPFRALGYGEYANERIKYDPLKLVLFDETARLSGFELRDELLKRNCVAEMADARYAVMAFGTGSAIEDGISLNKALSDIADHLAKAEMAAEPLTKITPTKMDETLPKPVLFGRELVPSKSAAIDHCVGLTAAEWVIPYPPGIPVLYPGETITEEIIKQLKLWKHEGAQIQGVRDPELNWIQVRADADDRAEVKDD
ncbi:aminotransferase class I/II-fold pyridoxal phosphate-dependent enzyme [Cohnella cholangitidis]|uniref:Aminotransferase class I/II-fold pyridoxal phosphate-dependent enzyme n=1 Tax=Cohnella cholangitidis TaxID=2598458 RepID=A0A7G5BZ19_9BACL|nr:aminotransferase class I/II-fold pyridoxal phosphate-dependent enzyme [Cohnella cholangitidis]QMV42203.1 aminotransferase class I/II-fold pyridoxal phosphate-dependent enzyme [Cohnella cholangitidis]